MDNTTQIAEQFVIGGLLLLGDMGGDQAQNVLAMLKPSSFADLELSVAFDAVGRIAERGGRVDAFSVYAEAQRDKRCTDRLEDYLFELAGSAGSSANIVSYAEAVREKAIERCAVESLHKALALITDPTAGDVHQRIGQAESVLSAINDRAMKNGGLRHVREIGKEWVGQVSAQVEGGVRGFTLGIDALDRLLYPKRVPPGSLVVVGARPKMGKEQPLDSQILMADGSWKLMGDIAIGDKVASVDGGGSCVTGIFPQGVKDVYEVEFSDGRIAECGLEHLWTVYSSRFAEKKRTVTTAELSRLVGMKRYESRISLPQLSGDFGREMDIGVDPWLLGVLLGDGGLSSGTPRLTNSEEYIVGKVRRLLPDGVRMVPDGDITFRLSGDGKENPLTASLKALGIFGCRAETKRIPGKLLCANREFRAALLAGLLETDGWVEKSGAMLFSSSSEDLIHGVAELVWSLGGVARRKTKTNIKYSYKGQKKDGMDAHVLTIRLPSPREVIGSPRLLANIKETQKKTSAPVVKAIRRTREAECQCIMVDHPEHLYVTDNYIVTHNTAIMGKIMSHFALKRREAVACFSLEMPDVQIYERMIVGESGVDPEIFYRAAKDVDDWSRVNAAAKAYNDSLLYVDDTPGVRLSHIQREARRLNKQHRIGLVAVDYLTLMDGDGAERNDLAYGKITKSLKNLAKELNCVVLLLSQLNRALESRQDKRPFPSDSRDTGQIEQDCDLWIGLYREGAYTDHPDDDRTEVIVRMNRHGRTGTVYVKQENGAIVETPDQEPRTVDRKPARVAYGRES